MSKFFYFKLALNNIKKNSKTYMPYLLTCIGTIMMFYNMCFLVVAKDIGSVSDSVSLRQVLYFGAVVIGIFSLIFLFYTNSFLIKKRKKEFGLFNVLGMEKKHVAKIMLYETLFTAVVSLVAGLASGILFSKLMILLLLKLINFNATFGFEIPLRAIIWSIVLFSGIFIINLIYNVFQVHLANPIELLKGGNVGEKEPKTKFIMTILGFSSLVIGYYIAVTTESPLAALNLFFVAVLLVILGTYCLFTAGSIAILKVLRKNKKYYYNPKNFISVSSMIYRMKQNAAGLANICILSTSVIIMISSTVSMYVGMEDVIGTRYPRNVIVSAYDVSNEQAEKVDTIIKDTTKDFNTEIERLIQFKSKSFFAFKEGTTFIPDDYNSYQSDRFTELLFIAQDEYNKLENTSVTLNKGEAIIYSARDPFLSNTLDINGYKLTIVDNFSSIKLMELFNGSLTNMYIVVVDNVDTIEQVYNSLRSDEEDMDGLSYFYGFDVNADEDIQLNIIRALNEEFVKIDLAGNADGSEASKEMFYLSYGGLFFLGIFLGLLFIMATVLIIYYKQIAEGYDDKERFNIMQKVGMSREEVKQSIKNQVLIVFFLPLITAIVHISFAFTVITRLLALFNFTNVPLFALCTVATIVAFALIYTFVYILTARTYYKIVS